MPDLTLILLGAGNSTRFNHRIKKQWLWIEDKPLWLFVTKNFEKYINFKEIIVVASQDELNYMKNFADYTFVEGGNERQISLKNALNKVKSKHVLVSDIARVCIDETILQNLLKYIKDADIVVPALKATDTIHFKGNPIDRDQIKLIQTPQLSKTEILKKALSTDKIFTDDSSAIHSIGRKVKYIEGSKKALKLTHKEDLNYLECIKPPSKESLCGIGFDVHPFEKDRAMYLGGIKIDVPYGFKAHSDGDVALHALIDALLGAIGYGDIGELFPDSSKIYKDIDSKELLKKVVSFIDKVGFEIINTDINIIAQKPKITPYKNKMKKAISNILKIPKYKVNIKATTTEKLGFIGREEGVAVQAIASVRYFDWSCLLEVKR